MTDDGSISFKDTRSGKKRGDLKKEKWMRQIKENNSTNHDEADDEQSKSDVDEKVGRNRNLVANPTNYHPRSRSESPPPKSKRSNKGINRGKPPACSFCRPEIHHRMSNTADIRSELREIERTDFRTDDL